ncbi:MAG: hypothetical protein ACOZBL_02905 [Patescibacteria group bacterium]
MQTETILSVTLDIEKMQHDLNVKKYISLNMHILMLAKMIGFVKIDIKNAAFENIVKKSKSGRI